MKEKNIGTSFESWLDEEGVAGEVAVVAVRRALARQLADAMRREGMTKTEMASKMGTGRGALDRLLDAENRTVTLATLCKAAEAVGLKVRLDLV